MSVYDNHWQLTSYRSDGYGDEVRRRLYGGVLHRDEVLSEYVSVTEPRSTADVTWSIPNPAPEPRPEPSVIEFGRGLMLAPVPDWKYWAAIVGFMAVGTLWAGIVVYGVMRGLQELERVL